MELGPIFRALVHSKARFWLVAVEVALTLAIVVNCINMMLDMRSEYTQDTGIDEEHVLAVRTEPMDPAFQEEGFRQQVERRDLEALRAFPGVRAAAMIDEIPLSGGGSATGRKILGSELDMVTVPYFEVSEGLVAALGAEVVAGRDLGVEDFALERLENGDIPHRNVLISQRLADLLFPRGDALGQTLQNNNGQFTNTIVGLVSHFPNSWPDWREVRGRSMVVPGEPSSAQNMTYLVGVEPGSVDAVASDLEALLLRLEPDRQVQIRTLAEHKQETLSSSIALVKMLTSVIVLLVIVTSLGIIGLTAFSVSQRTREIGTRRAIGATKGDIVRYFLVENWIITSTGLALGVGLTYGLNIALVNLSNAPKMSWPLIAGGMALLWVTGLLAALAPAVRAAQVAPVVATRTI
jgi:putative ABC transport system permease protein